VQPEDSGTAPNRDERRVRPVVLAAVGGPAFAAQPPGGLAARSLLERWAAMNRTLLDVSADGICVVDLEGRTVLANTIIEQLAAEVRNLPNPARRPKVTALAPRPADAAGYFAPLEALSSNRECVTHDRFDLAGTQRAFERHSGPVRDMAGAVIGHIIVVREISGDREAEALQSEITEKREAVRANSELVATVSHELRTPLTAVLGFAELLLHHDVDGDTTRRYLETIVGEAQRLTGLIDAFLDLERLEAGRFTLALECFDLREVVQHQVELFSAQSAHHQLDFAAPDVPLALVGDRDRIGQVIANLLSNAIKYSPAGGAVRITATSGEGFTRVCVTDTGLGIAAAHQAQIFTKFFRSDSSDTRKIGGTGLGLALCQEIVGQHGGRIGFESTEGAGARFWFELPSAGSAGAAKPSARVLVVADDFALTRLLGESLALAGMQIESAPSGVSALERALALPPAAICLDVELSGELDGWQVLVRLKANAITARIPVVVCSNENGRNAAATLGAAAFVVKPFTVDQLHDAVAQQLAAERKSVLVVGGDQSLRRLIIETLARDGGELREAADALEALTSIATRTPDALVFDLSGPGPDGFTELEQLLERPETRGLPVVVLTGRELSAGERRFLAERNASLLEKRAYSGDQLRRLVRHAPFPSITAALLASYDIPIDDATTDDLLVRAPVELRPAAQPQLPAAPPPTDKETRPRAD
jgi:signal transduction histidine kinase/CheY-like chemotaxis protein